MTHLPPLVHFGIIAVLMLNLLALFAMLGWFAVDAYRTSRTSRSTPGPSYPIQCSPASEQDRIDGRTDPVTRIDRTRDRSPPPSPPD
jgi:hypothetical protein